MTRSKFVLELIKQYGGIKRYQDAIVNDEAYINEVGNFTYCIANMDKVRNGEMSADAFVAEVNRRKIFDKN